MIVVVSLIPFVKNDYKLDGHITIFQIIHNKKRVDGKNRVADGVRKR